MKVRITVSAILILLVLFMPYWFYLPLIAVAILLLPFYVEGILLALLTDSFYGAFGSGLFILNFPLAITAGILFSLSPFLRRRLRISA